MLDSGLHAMETEVAPISTVGCGEFEPDRTKHFASDRTGVGLGPCSSEQESNTRSEVGPKGLRRRQCSRSVAKRQTVTRTETSSDPHESRRSSETN
jgi:hypothetical protein